MAVYGLRKIYNYNTDFKAVISQTYQKKIKTRHNKNVHYNLKVGSRDDNGLSQRQRSKINRLIQPKNRNCLPWK